MRLISRGALAAMLIAAATAAHAAPKLDTADDVRREFNALVKLKQATPATAARIDAMLAAPALAQLEPVERCGAYWIGGAARFDLKDYAAADRYYAKAVECPDLPKDAWEGLFQSALGAEDWDNAAKAMQVLLDRFPAELATYKDWTVFQTVHHAGELEKGAERRFALLNALYDSGWKPSEGGMSYLWGDLAAALVDRGLTIRAGRVVQAIDAPHILAHVRADKRFDDLFDHAAPQFDPNVQAGKSLERAARKAADNPRKLADLNAYAFELLVNQHPDMVLKLMDDTLARVAAAPKGKPAYDDLDDQLIWVKDYRQRALSHLGRHDEALAVELEASKDKEHGGDNVSQVINLAQIYASLGRPQDALATVDAMKGGVSPYGRMQVELARVMAYAQLGDAAKLKVSLDYMKAHEADAPASLTAALIAANDLDALAALYVRRLADPDKRLQALGELQRWSLATNPTPIEQQWNQRAEALRNRPDMKAAIDAVGRINSLSFQDEPG